MQGSFLKHAMHFEMSIYSFQSTICVFSREYQLFHGIAVFKNKRFTKETFPTYPNIFLFFLA